MQLASESIDQHPCISTGHTKHISEPDCELHCVRSVARFVEQTFDDLKNSVASGGFIYFCHLHGPRRRVSLTTKGSEIIRRMLLPDNCIDTR